MPRYIDAENIDFHYIPYSVYPNVFVTKEDIDKIPTADVAPVVHGHWIRKNKELSPGFLEESLVCSECDAEYDLTLMRVCCTDVLIFPICPCCGAKMDEEEEKK